MVNHIQNIRKPANLLILIKDESQAPNNDGGNDHDDAEGTAIRRYPKRQRTETNYMMLEVPDDDSFLCKCFKTVVLDHLYMTLFHDIPT